MKRKKLPPGILDLGDGTTLNLEVESPPKRPAPKPPKPKRRTDPIYWPEPPPPEWETEAFLKMLQVTPASFRETWETYVLPARVGQHLVMDAGGKPDLPATIKRLDELIVASRNESVDERERAEGEWMRRDAATGAWMGLSELLDAVTPDMKAIRAGVAAYRAAVRAGNRANKRTIELYDLRTAVVRGLPPVALGYTEGQSQKAKKQRLEESVLNSTAELYDELRRTRNYSGEEEICKEIAKRQKLAGAYAWRKVSRRMDIWRKKHECH